MIEFFLWFFGCMIAWIFFTALIYRPKQKTFTVEEIEEVIIHQAAKRMDVSPARFREMLAEEERADRRKPTLRVVK